MISFTLNGKPIRPDEIGDTLMKAAVASISNQMRDRLSAIRHPETGEFPTVVAFGDSLDSLRFQIEGSPELLSLVKQKLAPEELAVISMTEKSPSDPPRAFLSFAWEDRALAKTIAEGLQRNGIDTWWAEWEIRAGDSLRQ